MSHRIEYLGYLPRKVGIAVSGGPDSMAILDFLSRGNREIKVLHFNHGTEHGKEAEDFVVDYCDARGLDLYLGKVYRERTTDESPEEYWRNQRYSFFSQFDLDIITCHNLDDQVENWLFTSIRNGNPTLIPYERGVGRASVFRPFLLTKKVTLENWCERKGVPYLVDPSNSSDKYARSYIRKELVPRALHVNPGIYKMIKKKVQKEFDSINTSK